VKKNQFNQILKQNKIIKIPLNNVYINTKSIQKWIVEELMKQVQTTRVEEEVKNYTLTVMINRDMR
jgi:hypothetical protein